MSRHDRRGLDIYSPPIRPLFAPYSPPIRPLFAPYSPPIRPLFGHILWLCSSPCFRLLRFRTFDLVVSRLDSVLFLRLSLRVERTDKILNYKYRYDYMRVLYDTDVII